MRLYIFCLLINLMTDYVLSEVNRNCGGDIDVLQQRNGSIQRTNSVKDLSIDIDCTWVIHAGVNQTVWIEVLYLDEGAHMQLKFGNSTNTVILKDHEGKRALFSGTGRTIINWSIPHDGVVQQKLYLRFNTSEGGPDPVQTAYTHSNSNPVSPSPDGPITMTRIPRIFGPRILSPSENPVQDSSALQGGGESGLDDKNRSHVPQETTYNGPEKAGAVISDLAHTVTLPHYDTHTDSQVSQKFPAVYLSSLHAEATAAGTELDTDTQGLQKSPPPDPHIRVKMSSDNYNGSPSPFRSTPSGDGTHADQKVGSEINSVPCNRSVHSVTHGHDITLRLSETTANSVLAITAASLEMTKTNWSPPLTYTNQDTGEHAPSLKDLNTPDDLKVPLTTKSLDSTTDHQATSSEGHFHGISTLTSLAPIAREVGKQSHLTTETRALETEAGRTNRSPRSTHIVNQTSSEVTDLKTFNSTPTAVSQDQTDRLATTMEQVEISENPSPTFRYRTEYPSSTNFPITGPHTQGTDTLESTTDAQQTSDAQFATTNQSGFTKPLAPTTLHTSLSSSSMLPMDSELPLSSLTSKEQHLTTSATPLPNTPNYDKEHSQMSATTLQFSSSSLSGITTPWIGSTVTTDTTQQSPTTGLYDSTESTSGTSSYTQTTSQNQTRIPSPTPDSEITDSSAVASSFISHATHVGSANSPEMTTINMYTHAKPGSTELTHSDFTTSYNPVTTNPLVSFTSHIPSSTQATLPSTPVPSIATETSITSKISNGPTSPTSHPLMSVAWTKRPETPSQSSDHLTTSIKTSVLQTRITTGKTTTILQVQSSTASLHSRFGPRTPFTPSTQRPGSRLMPARTEKDWMHKGRVLIIGDQPAILKKETFPVLFQVRLEGNLSSSAEFVEVEAFLQQISGYQSQHVTWHRGQVFQSVATFKTAESISWLGKAESLLEEAGLKPLPSEGLFVGGVRVQNITVGGLHGNVCSWLFSCPSGFYCVSFEGNASCRSVCHSDYCKHHGICVHGPGQPPVCQCPVGEDFWFMGQQCDLRMTRQRLAWVCFGVLITVAALMAILAYVAVRRFKNMLIQAKAEQTQSSYRRFNHFDELSARFWRRSWPGSEDSLDNVAFTRSDELLHMRALDRPCCYHDDTLSIVSTYPGSASHLNTVYLHGSQYQWDMSTCSLADCVVDSGKASDLSVCSWPIEPIQWTPFPLLQQLRNTTPVKSSRSRSYCEGMELVDMEKSRTA